LVGVSCVFEKDVSYAIFGRRSFKLGAITSGYSGICNFAHIVYSDSFAKRSILKSPGIIVDLFVSLSSLPDFTSCILKLCLFVHMHLGFLFLPSELTRIPSQSLVILYLLWG
jgi:hypothetical protein